MMFLSFLLACSGGTPDEPAAFTPTLATSNCGGPAYDWIPSDEVGDLVEWEPVREATLGPNGVDALQEGTGQKVVESALYGVKTYRYRYTTQDRGQPVEATGLVAFPDTNGEPLETKTMLWLHPTVGMSDGCAPSVSGIEHTVPLMIGASQGLIAVAPDYLGMAGFGEPSGMLHPYLVPEPTAVASLDAVRAMEVLATSPRGPELGVVPTKEMVIWGVSEGGFASLWTDRYQPHYAPEFEVQGVVAAIPGSDVVGLAQHGVTVFGDTSWGILAMLVTANPWFAAGGSMADILTDEAPTFFASTLGDILATECEPGDGPEYDAVDSVEDIYLPGFVEALKSNSLDDLDSFGCMLENATLPGSPVERVENSPTLFVVAELDMLAYAGVERESARQLCAEGQDIEYIECEGADHVDGAVYSLAYQWRWLERRIRGESWLDGGSCVIGEPEDCEAL